MFLLYTELQMEGVKINKGRLQNPNACWTAVLSGSDRFLLFLTIATARNRTESPVNRELGFKIAPKSKKFEEGFLFENPYSASINNLGSHVIS